MPEEDELIKELESLRGASKSAVDVDSTIDFNTNIERRKTFITELIMIKNKLIEKMALYNQFSASGKTYIRSYYQAIIKPKGIIQDIDPSDVRITFPVEFYGVEGFKSIDNLIDRTLSFDEFTERFNILINAVFEGKLDDVLGKDPALVIHSIMGFSGELLDKLEIDPKKGETYKMLNEINNYHSSQLPLPDYKSFTDTVSEIVEAIKIGTNKKEIINPINLTPHTRPIKTVGDLPFIGVVGISLTPEIAKIIKLDENTQGILIHQITKNSTAEKAGLQTGNNFIKIGNQKIPLEGDIITEINGLKVTKIEELYEYFDRYYLLPSGLTFRILRKGQSLDLKIV